MSALLVDWEEQKGFISLWPFHYVDENAWKGKREAFLESQKRADLVAHPDPDCQKILQEDLLSFIFHRQWCILWLLHSNKLRESCQTNTR